MSKKNKHANKNFDTEAPDVYNMDDIGYMVDDAIRDRANHLENERNYLLSVGGDAYSYELELAYLQREQQIRLARGEQHAKFIQRFGAVRNTVDPVDETATDITLEPTGNLN